MAVLQDSSLMVTSKQGDFSGFFVNLHHYNMSLRNHIFLHESVLEEICTLTEALNSNLLKSKNEMHSTGRAKN